MSPLDTWKPVASASMLRARAKLLSDIRCFFSTRNVMEVETPILSSYGTTDPAIESFNSRYSGPGLTSENLLFLHTSPEFPMKRLLAGGSGPIYQICKVFRQGEFGRLHNPEFTMLEWYRPGYDYHQLMDEVEALVERLLPEQPVERLTYQQLFLRYLEIDPLASDADSLKQAAIHFGVSGADSLELDGTDGWLDLLLTHLIEPKMPHGLCFVYDYPASQASLAKLSTTLPQVAERFELYIDGVEVANGFHELTDANEQASRFKAEELQREEGGLTLVPHDRHLVSALEQGLPNCSGVALGLDRLLMLISGASAIQEVLAFPLDRA